MRECNIMKIKYILFLIICFCGVIYICFFSRKPPVEFIDCVEIYSDERYFTFYLKTNESNEYYDLQIMGLNSKYIIYKQDFIDWNVVTFVDDNKFCFKIDKNCIKISEVYSAKIGLYNKKTLREELYIFMRKN